MLDLTPFPRENDPDFGPQYMVHVGNGSFGVADYYYSPKSGVPDQTFTKIFLGWTHVSSPIPANALIAVSIGLLFLSAALAAKRRKSSRG